MSVKNYHRMANSVDPDETAHYKPSHLDLQFEMVFVLVCQAERVKTTIFVYICIYIP